MVNKLKSSSNNYNNRTVAMAVTALMLVESSLAYAQEGHEYEELC